MRARVVPICIVWTQRLADVATLFVLVDISEIVSDRFWLTVDTGQVVIGEVSILPDISQIPSAE
jgi:hypothetical protein